jgi:hypothetical protein
MNMGYRSDVGLCLNTEGKKILQDALSALEGDQEHTRLIRELFNSAERKEDTDSSAVAYMWRDVKWYADYSDVAFVESLLQSIGDDTYLFIRVGESDDDTEQRGCFWDNPLGMCLVRGIAFN